MSDSTSMHNHGMTMRLAADVARTRPSICIKIDRNLPVGSLLFTNCQGCSFGWNLEETLSQAFKSGLQHFCARHLECVLIVCTAYHV